MSPVTTALEPKPMRVRNIFICSLVVFCASSRITKESLSERPRMKASGATSMTLRSIELGDAFETQHLVQRVVHRTQVRIDLLRQIAGQKSEPLARLDGGPHQDDAPHAVPPAAPPPRRRRRDRSCRCRPGRCRRSDRACARCSGTRSDWRRARAPHRARCAPCNSSAAAGPRPACRLTPAPCRAPAGRCARAPSPPARVVRARTNPAAPSPRA